MSLLLHTSSFFVKNNLLGDPIVLGGMSIPFGGASAKTARGSTTGSCRQKTRLRFQSLVLGLFVY